MTQREIGGLGFEGGGASRCSQAVVQVDGLPEPLTLRQRVFKRAFDLVVAVSGLLLLGWLVGITWVVATLALKRNGLFRQVRIGRHGRPFQILKIRTMRDLPRDSSSVTVAADVRVTPIGCMLRRMKIDELPQLWNVVIGDMSLVGPRPDVPGFADRLEGADRIVLSVRPGITGPATLHYRDEEAELARHPDPEEYNRQVIFPEKVRLNRAYVEHYSLATDFLCLWRTLLPRLGDRHSEQATPTQVNSAAT